MKVRKRVFKPVAILMAVCMLVQFSGISVAVEDNVSVEFVFSCDVDCKKSQQIIAAITGETFESGTFIGVSPASILCLFGHNMAQTTATETNHRFFRLPHDVEGYLTE